jgi:hypothetical protein
MEYGFAAFNHTNELLKTICQSQRLSSPQRVENTGNQTPVVEPKASRLTDFSRLTDIFVYRTIPKKIYSYFLGTTA